MVPVAQWVLAGIPPTAAIGLALTSDEPVATAAVSEVELVIIPQPMSTSALPVAVMPVTAVFSRLMTQYLPDATMVAVPTAVMVGVALMNMPEKLSFFCTASATRTALLSAVRVPVDGGLVVDTVVVMPTCEL